MYTQHFHLTEPPFSIAPNPRYLYLSPQHREALAHLLYGIGVGGGFVVLTGEVGTGKTTLCRALLDQLPDDVDIALIFNPRLNSRELLAGICDELHIQYAGPKASLKQLIDALNRHLLEAHARGRRVIVLIDEAQNLRFDVLEQVRLLTNLETNQAKLLQIILVGQPELNHILDRPNLRQLAQRITARYHLNPLSLTETRDYIRHRLVVAGGSERTFTRLAIRAIHHRSRGIPRLINLIADRALLGAYTLGRLKVSGRVAWRAARELMSKVGAPGPGRWVALLTLLAFSTAVAIYLDAIPNPLAELGEPPEPARAFESTGQAVAAMQEAANDAVAAPESSAPKTNSAATVKTVPAFAEWLDNPQLEKSSATAKLLSLWSLTVPADTPDPCELAVTQGLRCQSLQGSWLQFRNFNLPGVLEFVLPTGERRYATLVTANAEEVELANRDVSTHAQLGELLQLWSGKAVVVWKPVGDDLINVSPGAVAPVIGWVRTQLGVPTAPGRENLYDETLKHKVIEFQTSRALKPDGILGTQTLLSLQTAMRNPTVPQLTTAAPD